MKPKPDDRSDNVEKIQENIDNTVRNIRQTNEMLSSIDDPEMQADNRV